MAIKESRREKKKFLGNVNRVRGVIFPNAVLISVHAARPLGLTSDSSERLMVARLINCITPLLDTLFPGAVRPLYRRPLGETSPRIIACRTGKGKSVFCDLTLEERWK
ncbi:hypothetical protein CEXT_661121 [Caerostris extrusa]|uniref:Uncharacterized protein n=1 Tax=Caerostris extrusa TaxID=172846 RepID=A0AAV4NJ10_CAEEX|nr:hypothetical protein CEXT_661121 [Caerostris extrusa]